MATPAASPPPFPRSSRSGFHDRVDAGRTLAARLVTYAHREDVVVQGIPRGGVPVAYEVARALGAPLDVVVVRKLGLPIQEELAMGAIASGGVRVVNAEIVRALGVEPAVIDEVAARELVELERREGAYRQGRPPVEVAGKTVIVVDDGLATGSTMLAAVTALRQRGASCVVCAVPVAPPSSLAKLAPQVDDLVSVIASRDFFAVGQFYDNFRPTEDDEVSDLLAAAATIA